MNQNTLYIFIDESGNFDFSPVGTRYFVLTCISTLNPLKNRVNFLDLKYKLLTEGINQEFFRASEDKQLVRDEVFHLIEGLDDFEIDSVVAQKNKTNFALYEDIDVKQKPEGGFILKTKRAEEKFYKQISETLLQYVVRRYTQYRAWNIEKIIIVLGALFTKHKQEFVKKHLKTYFKENFQKIPYVYFHRVNADINCQIVDYCGWAIFIKWERNELRPYNQIKDKIKSEFDIFKRGETIYYNYKE